MSHASKINKGLAINIGKTDQLSTKLRRKREAQCLKRFMQGSKRAVGIQFQSKQKKTFIYTAEGEIKAAIIEKKTFKDLKKLFGQF